MFGTTLTLACTVMHIYVFWRVASVPVIRRRIPGKYIITAAASLWALFLVGRTYGHGREGSLPAALELLGMNWMASLFLICILLLVMDTVTAFGCLFPRHAPSLRGSAMMAGVMLAMVANVQGLRPPAVESCDLYLPGLPEELSGIVLIGLSDMHLGSTIGRSWLEDRIAQVREERPDIVVFLGDTF
ncbi:MAG: hypothetical protein ABIK28_07040 [Planctomycetota bacterium]